MIVGKTRYNHVLTYLAFVEIAHFIDVIQIVNRGLTRSICVLGSWEKITFKLSESQTKISVA